MNQDLSWLDTAKTAGKHELAAKCALEWVLSTSCSPHETATQCSVNKSWNWILIVKVTDINTRSE